jgi:peptidoglycan LD-endopeptidase LytH
VYSRSKVFDGNSTTEEPRRLHLGTDIWGDAGTVITAPLEGKVHSFAFNNQFGDYGATILLTHSLEGQEFYTLYGHLSLASLDNLQEGMKIDKGQAFATFGMAEENGHWPPHVHFQLIKDMQQWKGDYPGVCKYSEKEQWLANSPDPDIVLQLNRYV